MLQKAFWATMKDPAFLAEAKKTRIEVIPLNGAEVIEVIKRVQAYPDEAISLAKSAIRDKNFVRKVTLKTVTATITGFKKGRRMGLLLKTSDGKKALARVHGRRSKITISSKKAKPKELKVGMSCQFAYTGSGGIAFKIACD